MPRGRGKTSEERAAMLALHQAGHCCAFIARTLNMNPETVRRTILRHRQAQALTFAPRSGRPKKLTARGQRALVRITRDSRMASLADLTRDIASTVDTPICLNTVRNNLHDVGYHAHVAACKPKLTK